MKLKLLMTTGAGGGNVVVVDAVVVDVDVDVEPVTIGPVVVGPVVLVVPVIVVVGGYGSVGFPSHAASDKARKPPIKKFEMMLFLWCILNLRQSVVVLIRPYSLRSRNPLKDAQYSF